MKSTILLFFWLMASATGIAQEWNKTDKDGKKHGAWRGFFEESKRVRYEGQFENGREVGIFKYYDDTKAHPVIATRDFSKAPGAAYTIFYDQKKNVVSEGNVVGKVYDGLWKYYHQASPQLMTTEYYKNGKLDGTRTVYYKSGKIAEETTYKDGVRHGPYKKYTETGIVLEESNYANGRFEGPATYRDGEGQVVSKGVFKNGAKHGYWEFYKNGKLDKKEKYPIRKAKTGTPKKAAPKADATVNPEAKP